MKKGEKIRKGGGKEKEWGDMTEMIIQPSSPKECGERGRG